MAPHQIERDYEGVAPPSPPQILIRPPTFRISDGSHDDVAVKRPIERDYDSDTTTNSGSGIEFQLVAHSPELQPLTRSTSPSPFDLDAEGLPIIEGSEWPLDTLLRKCEIKTPDGSVGGFWTLRLLRHICSRERVEAQIRKDIEDENLVLGAKTTIEQLVEAIHPLKEPHPYSEEDKNHYMRIYALLLLCEESHRIAKFVELGESDKVLPIKLDLNQNGRHTVKSECMSPYPDITVQSFNKMKEHLKNYIYAEQRRLLTPYFELETDNVSSNQQDTRNTRKRYRARHMDLPIGTILPWWQRDDRSMSSSDPSNREGGYGFVSKVKIHPTSHGFRGVLQTIQLSNELFALKKLLVTETKNHKDLFRNELDNLHRFSGMVHDHLVTLLATFTLENNYYFLFPCAECALDEYWEEKDRSPVFDLATVRWVSSQISGIMAAIDTIHEPRHVHLLTPDEKRYGRHGDIKPDNILWFMSGRDPRGILVVSDMGLTSFNRDVSRSNIPGRNMPGVPGYRPPECEVKGGKVSRSFDIWTLGCLYLEMVTWLLGGWEFLEKFQEHRRTEHIDGTRKEIFFDLKDHVDSEGTPTGQTVAMVKREVKEWFVALHAHSNCTQFVHDVLDKVEEEMLVVLSEDKKRSMSGPLRRDFQRMHDRCMAGNNPDYAIKKVPEQRKRVDSIAVEARLAPDIEEALERSKSLGKTLKKHSGAMQSSMTERALETMDEVEEGMQSLAVRNV